MYAPEEAYPVAHHATSVDFVQCERRQKDVLNGPVNVVVEEYPRIENVGSPYRWVLTHPEGSLRKAR